MPFFTFLYNLFLLLALPVTMPLWGLYLLMSPKARAGFWEKLGQWPTELKNRFAYKDPKRPRIWFHAVSVGEFNAIRPLVKDLSAQFEVVISTTTRTGQTLAKQVFPDLFIFYYPYDLRPVVNKVVSFVKPDLVVLTETELWPNFIDRVARKSGIPMLLINGRISKSSYRGYLWIQPLMQEILSLMTHLYMQSQADSDRIRDLGDLPAEQVTVVGNLKFDTNTQIDPIQKNILSHLLKLAPDEDATVMIFASTHRGEDEQFTSLYLELKKDFPELKMILAPRHPERRDEIKTILATKGVSFSLRSQLTETYPNEHDVLVLDSIGELVTVYSLCHIAVMGGSFVGRGGQNPLEAIGQCLPVIFGPDMSNFKEISRLILEHEAGFQVESVDDIRHLVTHLLTQPEQVATIVENGQRLLGNNRGTKEILSIAIQQAITSKS